MINLISGGIKCLGKSVNLSLLIETALVRSIPLLFSKALSCIVRMGTPEFLRRAAFFVLFYLGRKKKSQEKQTHLSRDELQV